MRAFSTSHVRFVCLRSVKMSATEEGADAVELGLPLPPAGAPPPLSSALAFLLGDSYHSEEPQTLLNALADFAFVRWSRGGCFGTGDAVPPPGRCFTLENIPRPKVSPLPPSLETLWRGVGSRAPSD